ncbi:MAG: hypothetical protein J5693_05985, partial [Bacteroidales bacterium]|nr:hypothetical protein [Bacteroidales bacterium]
PQPAAQPAAPAPEPVKAAPRAASSATAGVSIKNLMSKVSQPEAAPAKAESAEAAPKADVEITPELLEQTWPAFIASIEQPKLKAALNANKPQYAAQDNAVTQFVASELQKNWILEKQLHILTDKLRKAIGNGSVRLRIEVLPPQESDTASNPYMPTEVAREMMKDSKQMSDFSREFELEVS